MKGPGYYAGAMWGGTALVLFCVIALALGDEVELNEYGCPIDSEIHRTVAHDTYCNLFYNCLNGIRVEQNCPKDLVFNPYEGVCDWSKNVNCGGKGLKEIESEESVETVNPGGNRDPSAAVEICAREKSDGVLVAHENCNEFYKCDSGVPVSLECLTGLLYNYELGICDWPENVVCGDRVFPTFTQMKRAALRHK